ncbi:MAG: ATP synthase F1 subunit gamma [Deltaproteobacteria bacterium]|nr:ATP synthase F1 subunit gamma [Deltaproteobacteria bacterium]
MASLRDIKRRIQSVKNTRQITKAMKMVSGAKLKRATDRAVAARPYQESLSRVLGRVAAAAGDTITHPLLVQHEQVEKVLVVVMGSDRGLCGSFNGNIFRRLERHIEKEREGGKTVSLRTFGKKARGHFGRRNYNIVSSVTDLTFLGYADAALVLADQLSAEFANGDVHEVWLSYNYFKSAGTQIPTITRLLPLSVAAGGKDGGAAAPKGGAAGSVEYKYEPDGQRLLDILLPMQLRTILLQALLDTEAGEHAARMSAMDNATRNAGDLISSLTLVYNRGRQAAITKELIEIVSGAEAI